VSSNSIQLDSAMQKREVCQTPHLQFGDCLLSTSLTLLSNQEQERRRWATHRLPLRRYRQRHDTLCLPVVPRCQAKRSLRGSPLTAD
jgi:hypothetical protein